MVITTPQTDDVITDMKDKLIADMVFMGVGTDDTTAEAVGNTDLDDEIGTNFGDATTRIDITDQGGDTFRYTWDGTGTDPEFDTDLSATDVIRINSTNFNAANNGDFTVDAVDAGGDWFEVTNASGVAEADKLLGEADAMKMADRVAILLVWNGGTQKLADDHEYGTAELNGNTLKEIGLFDGDQFGDSLRFREVITDFAKTSSDKFKVEFEFEIGVSQ